MQWLESVPILWQIMGSGGLGSIWTNQAELAAVWQPLSGGRHSNRPNVGMSVAQLSSNMPLMWGGSAMRWNVLQMCGGWKSVFSQPLHAEQLEVFDSRNLPSFSLARELLFWSWDKKVKTGNGLQPLNTDTALQWEWKETGVKRKVVTNSRQASLCLLSQLGGVLASLLPNWEILQATIQTNVNITRIENTFKIIGKITDIHRKYDRNLEPGRKPQTDQITQPHCCFEDKNESDTRQNIRYILVLKRKEFVKKIHFYHLLKFIPFHWIWPPFYIFHYPYLSSSIFVIIRVKITIIF